MKKKVLKFLLLLFIICVLSEILFSAISFVAFPKTISLENDFNVSVNFDYSIENQFVKGKNRLDYIKVCEIEFDKEHYNEFIKTITNFKDSNNLSFIEQRESALYLSDNNYEIPFAEKAIINEKETSHYSYYTQSEYSLINKSILMISTQKCISIDILDNGKMVKAYLSCIVG